VHSCTRRPPLRGPISQPGQRKRTTSRASIRRGKTPPGARVLEGGRSLKAPLAGTVPASPRNGGLRHLPFQHRCQANRLAPSRRGTTAACLSAACLIEARAQHAPGQGACWRAPRASSRSKGRGSSIPPRDNPRNCPRNRAKSSTESRSKGCGAWPGSDLSEAGNCCLPCKAERPATLSL